MGDCLLWIDGQYRTIEIFLREARERGCCRRMSSWPEWMKPGESRVFLAHRDGHTRTDFGSIFAYFTLGGVGIIGGPDGHGGPVKPVEPPLGGLPDPSPGSSAQTPTPPGGAGDPNPGGGYPIPPDQASLEAERLCGDRSEDGAVYFVDALARTIDSLFSSALEKLVDEMLAEDRQTGRKPRTRRRAIAKLQKAPARPSRGASVGSEEFDKAVRRAGSGKLETTKVPKDLKPHVRWEGALVVFEAPYPSFQRIPRAAFRNLLAIDGDELLRRIATAYAGGERERIVTLPYHRHPTNGRKTKAQLIAELAEAKGLDKAFAERIWGAFAEMIAVELAQRDWMTFTGVGTFKVSDREESRRLKFEPSARLRREARLN